jgi:hypothetical protein
MDSSEPVFGEKIRLDELVICSCVANEDQPYSRFFSARH